MTIKIKKEVSLKLPKMPNFLRYEDDSEKYIAVADLSKEEIDQVASAIYYAFIAHAHQKISEKKRNK